MSTIGTSTKLFAVIAHLTLGAASHAQFTIYNPTNTEWPTVANVRIDPTAVNGGNYISVTGAGYTNNFGATATAGSSGIRRLSGVPVQSLRLLTAHLSRNFPAPAFTHSNFSNAVGAFGFEGIGDDLIDLKDM